MKSLPFSRLCVLLLAVATLVLLTCLPALGQKLEDINPDQSSLHTSDPDGASGGRVNGLATVAGDNKTFYAASEWGGLHKSTDAGKTWVRLDSHKPTVTWDVEVSPADTKRIFATSFYDGRVNSLSGISMSTDGGNTWTNPAGSRPPLNSCLQPQRRDEPSAFGISIDPNNSQNIYVGTNCGLAVSTDGGNNWQYIDPTPNTPADDIWDVVVHHGGIIDLCGDDGHQRSTDGGANWTTASATGTPLPTGTCSLAVSPDESYVLFAVAGTSIFESDDGGANWSTQFPNPKAQGRIPFVATNQRSGAAFDLWFGDVKLYRASCQTPQNPAPGGAARCPQSNNWAGPFTRSVGGHDDTGDIAFDTQAASDPCPVLMSSDGGVYYNTKVTSPDCQTPAWQHPDVTPHGLWVFGMGGASSVSELDLYFGVQDNGTFASTTAQLNKPGWSVRDCCDAFDVSADNSRVLYTSCCYSPAPANRLFVRGYGMKGGAELNTYPPGTLPSFTFADILDQFDKDSYVLITSAGVFITTNVGAKTVKWTQLGASTSPAGACGVQAARNGTDYVFYVMAGSCSGQQADTLWRYTGTGTNGTWVQVQPPGNTGGFNVFAVDSSDSNRLFASHVSGAGVEMVRSNDGGANWTNDAQLDKLMTGNGQYQYQNLRGPTSFTGFKGYQQPTLVAFDPADTKVLLAGGADSGIFMSTDGGSSWKTLTDNSGDESQPHIPRPWFAYFSASGIYLGTQGRGVWRYTFPSLGFSNLLNIYEVACPVIGCQLQLFDPHIYEFIDFAKLVEIDNCRGCTFELAFDGNIEDIVLNKDFNVKRVVMDRGGLRTFNFNGVELPPTQLSVQSLTMSGTRCSRLGKGGKVAMPSAVGFSPRTAFKSCPGCLRALGRGGVIRGVVMDGKKLRAVIVASGGSRGARP